MTTAQSPRLSVLALGLALGCVFLVAPACKKADNGGAKERKVTVKLGDAAAPEAMTANVATFDPNADIALDLDAYGSERPNEYEIQQRFFDSFEAMDACVWSEKERTGKTEEQLPGDVQMAVKLNPKQSRPFGVNATLPDAVAKSTKLNECLREAAAGVAYPTYDGPPVVVNFEFELDAGSVWVEE